MQLPEDLWFVLNDVVFLMSVLSILAARAILSCHNADGVLWLLKSIEPDVPVHCTVSDVAKNEARVIRTCCV